MKNYLIISIRQKAIRFQKKEIKKQKLDRLKTDFGFCIGKVPSPWTLTEIISENSKVYNFQIGKSDTCVVSLRGDSIAFQSDNDKFWTDLWIKETELDYNIEDLKVERLEFDTYLVIAVKTKNWTPVKIWCNRKATDKWYLKMTTELSRYKGDIKELEKLMNSITDQ